jgi:hypothetical protein
MASIFGRSSLGLVFCWALRDKRDWRKPCDASYRGAAQIGLLSGSAPMRSPEVDLLLKQTLHAIGEEQTCLDIRVGLEEIRQDRDEVSAAKPDRSSHDQFSGRSGVFAGGGALGLGHISENPLARGKIGASCLGKDELAARPVEQFRPQVGLELGDLAADRWQWRFQLLRPAEGRGSLKLSEQRST